MGKPYIIVLNKDRTLHAVKEKNIGKYILSDNTKCLLFPSLTNTSIYYPIIPNKNLLATNFNIEIIFDIGEFDFDNNWFEFKDRFKTNYTTESIIQFINYLTIFYRIDGFAASVEAASLNNYITLIRAMYPIRYKINFDYGRYIIDSGELKNKSKSGELNISSFSWITDERMSSVSDILFTLDSNKNNSSKLPSFMGLKDDTWYKFKTFNDIVLDNDDLILIKLDDFNAYYMTNYSTCKKMMHIESFTMELSITEPTTIKSSIYQEFANKIHNINQIERDALCRYLDDEFIPEINYEFNLGDIYQLITWMVFCNEIMNYLLALYKSDVSNPLCLIRHIGKIINTTFTYDEIQQGKFEIHLMKYIKERMHKKC